MKTTIRFAGLPVLFVLLLSACSKKDDENTTPKSTLVTVTAKNIDGDAADKGHFTLFSLADNKVIPNSDSATTKWDIGFRSTNIIINGGVSGPGAATAQVVSGIFNDLLVAPESGYVVDGTTLAIVDWYTYNRTTHIISPVPGKYIVMRTATGKYAKVEVFSYYKDAPTTPDGNSVARNYNFRYQLQANGTRDFK
ncbi:hypothetical protein DVR12_19230 [Chitinophaga silvatica]|uniref:HmuY protein n=1 Tax=Chitinophaga silvatica TaxID=2282649 RepID=A0A3E1Y7I1_9BACT|nr:HmuY family protein [Chitinophaga silvatica]RFS20693.1 hypothetical protein DVR12_19230 [Chitinophaga silvatica]